MEQSEAPGDTRRFRLGWSFYVALTLCAILASKLHFQDRILQLLEDEGIREGFAPGPLHAIGLWVYLFSLLLMLLVFFLPRLAAFLRRDSPLARTLLHAALFWVIGLLCWLSIDYDYMYLLYLFLYGGFLAIIEGVWTIPIRLSIFTAADLSNEAKQQLSDYAVDKWWRSVSLLWIVVVAIAITAAISWAGTPPVQPNEVTPSQYSQAALWKVRKLVLLVIPVLPGMAFLTWYVIRKTNSVYDSLIQLYGTSD